MKQNENERKFHYCVLYTQTLKQWEVTTVLKKKLPAGRGTVFYPCVELWRHDRKATEIKALFPGYLFVRSDMKMEELHKFIGEHRKDVTSFIRELRVSERKVSGSDNTRKAEETNEYQYTQIVLKEDETEFLDFLLACGNEDMDYEADRNDGREETETAAISRIPAEGVLRMSYGYREGGKYVVMKGPLREYQQRIMKVNVHDRKAYLNIKINGRAVRAGFEVKPKRYWFPDDKDAPMVLGDGTEVNLEKLRSMMMNSKQKG